MLHHLFITLTAVYIEQIDGKAQLVASYIIIIQLFIVNYEIEFFFYILTLI